MATYNVDLATGALYAVEWPSPGPPPRPRGPGRGGEWLTVVPNLNYARAVLVPELVERYLGQDYDTEILTANDPQPQTADASVPLLEGGFGPEPGGRRGPPTGPRGPPPDGGFRGPPPGNRSPRIIVAGPDLLLAARHKAGSLEALVEQTRRRNLAISAGLLLLILATSAALVRFSRQAEHLAEMQFNFVAGVSHELRTPLTVIRTAAFNLHGKLAADPEQVERYGKLIAGEGQKLTALVEQVLLFASGKAGAAVRKREPVHVETLIAQLAASSQAVIESRVDPDLPAVLGDEVALKRALQNLLENAVKYGGADHWVGIFASRLNGSLEIRVADHGPGIPRAEQAHIFDPGTGLGLDLVKTIVEAHGGSVGVESQPGQRTEFIVRLPAAP